MSAFGKYLKGETNMPKIDWNSIFVTMGKLAALSVILDLIF